MTTDESPIDEGGHSPGPYQSIVETIADGVFVLDANGTVVFVNETIEAFVGLDREELVGETFERLTDIGIFTATAYERFREAVAGIHTGDRNEKRITIETTDSRFLEIRLCAKRSGESPGDLVGTIREVTRREQALGTLSRQQQAIYRLYEASISSEMTAEEKIERALHIGCQFLELPIGFVAAVDGSTHRLDYVVGTDKYPTGSSRPLSSTYCRFTVDSDDPVTIRDAKEEIPSDDPAYEETGISCYIGTKIPVDGGLYGTFCFAAPDARDRSFTESEREFIRLLGLWAGHTIEKERVEATLRGLYDVGQTLLLAETKAEVARLGVDAAVELFDLPVTACWHYEEMTDSLQPLAATATAQRLVGETPAFERGEALAWESFDTGEIRTYDELAEEPTRHNPETPIRSEIHVPLGEQGLLVCGSTESRTFETVDIESLRLLGNLLRDSLIAIEQQRSLTERGEALQRQNEQLEEFTHIVAHDLRNPLAGAVGFLEIARETHDVQHFDRVKQSLDRMDALIGELLAIARDAREAIDPRTLSLSDIVEEAWSYLDTPKSTLSIADDLGVIYADETRLLQLLGNLFRNSIEHGAEHTDSDVTVEVGRLESGAGFYVADDGPGLPDGAREDILTLGRTTSETGNGIGFESITDVIEVHGWELSIPETEGGARFEIRIGDAAGTEAER